MFREITGAELLQRKITDPVFLVLDGKILPFEDVRILVDEIVKPAEEKPKEEKPKQRRKRRTAGEVEAAILKAWGRGERSISEIMKETGCDYKTVRKYIPATEAG